MVRTLALTICQRRIGRLPRLGISRILRPARRSGISRQAVIWWCGPARRRLLLRGTPMTVFAAARHAMVLRICPRTWRFAVAAGGCFARFAALIGQAHPHRRWIVWPMSGDITLDRVG